jgi:hypothetical protein
MRLALHRQRHILRHVTRMRALLNDRVIHRRQHRGHDRFRGQNNSDASNDWDEDRVESALL